MRRQKTTHFLCTFLCYFIDFFLAPSGSSLESSYILSPRKLFVNTFYKLFCAFFTISPSLYMLTRVFLCRLAHLTLYVVSGCSFMGLYLYGVYCFHSLFVCFFSLYLIFYLYVSIFSSFLFTCFLLYIYIRSFR